MTTPATNTITTLILNTIKHNWILAVTSLNISESHPLFLKVAANFYFLPKSIYCSNSIFKECDLKC